MKDFGSFVFFSIIFILLIILIELNSAEDVEQAEKTEPEPSFGTLLTSIIPKSLSPQVQMLTDLFKLKGQRIMQVGVAILGLGVSMLFKMFLIWVGPYLSSAPVQAIRSAVAQQASRELLSSAVTQGISVFQSLYG